MTNSTTSASLVRSCPFSCGPCRGFVAQKLQCSYDDAAVHPLHALVAGPAAAARPCHDRCQCRRAGDYADEIDAEIADADEASARAEAAWRVQQQLIA